MDSLIQWGITSFISILTLFAGRYWGLHDRRIEHDKKILKSILDVIPSNGSILFIRDYDFGGSFNIENIKEISSFLEISKRPDFRFLDKEIEKCRLSLVHAINQFDSFIGMNCYSALIKEAHIIGIKKAHEYQDINEYRIIKNDINELANNVCNSYDSLIFSASKKGIYTL
jgi:hypothetical protein